MCSLTFHKLPHIMFYHSHIHILLICKFIKFLNTDLLQYCIFPWTCYALTQVVAFPSRNNATACVLLIGTIIGRYNTRNHYTGIDIKTLCAITNNQHYNILNKYTVSTFIYVVNFLGKFAHVKNAIIFFTYFAIYKFGSFINRIKLKF